MGQRYAERELLPHCYLTLPSCSSRTRRVRLCSSCSRNSRRGHSGILNSAHRNMSLLCNCILSKCRLRYSCYIHLELDGCRFQRPTRRTLGECLGKFLPRNRPCACLHIFPTQRILAARACRRRKYNYPSSLLEDRGVGFPPNEDRTAG